MPLQKPSSCSISRSKRVRCSSRCASTSLPSAISWASRSRSSSLMVSIARSTVSRGVT
ncbi:Uncharacterised protein [Bordetella pertussis]|nr:Uncharacterised protein [Bordetella pertussis]